MLLTNLVLATHNKGKLNEFKKLWPFPSIQLFSFQDFPIPTIEETGVTFLENALLKARFFSQAAGRPALADDSGLCVPILKGAPGIYSARYAGEEARWEANVQKLLFELNGVPVEKRHAFFVCYLVFIREPQDPLPIIVQGFWLGSILFEPRGKNGFGYDPVFYVPQYHCSAAELDPEIKDKLSHRAMAMKALKKSLDFYLKNSL